MTKPAEYLRYTSKMNLDKAIHTLEGFLKGIAIDAVITAPEVRGLTNWISEHAESAHRQPFSEIMPKLIQSLKDGAISQEEKEDLLWVCGNLKSNSPFYDVLTSDIQRLHGLLHGLLADGILADAEIRKLSDWMAENEHLKGCYPFDEIDSLLTSVLADGKIDEKERNQLKDFFSEFTPVGMGHHLVGDPKTFAMSGICATCPDIVFDTKSFCLTGESLKATRDQLIGKIESVGGRVVPGIRADLDYLIVCAGGNPCWAFSCYGRKVEKAMEYRKKGARIVIAHENDLWDAIVENK